MNPAIDRPNLPTDGLNSNLASIHNQSTLDLNHAITFKEAYVLSTAHSSDYKIGQAAYKREFFHLHSMIRLQLPNFGWDL